MYCNYMQDNKNFQLCISFDSDTTTYEFTHKQLQSVKVKDMTTHM